jgi:ATP-dependent RNA circularization protein (DNA/RNA ligase family)
MNDSMYDSWHSYPKVYALGHRAIADLLLDDDIIVEEKVDGSQFSFGKFDGTTKVRSKGCQINTEYPEKMFVHALDVVRDLPLHDGWTYRAEYLKKPKHNALAYDRIPRNHLIVFDINTGHEAYLGYDDKAAEAERIGLECVPLIYRGKVDGPEQIQEWLKRVSILGGQNIEGVVLKNYKRFSVDGKAMIGKYVSEAYKEAHGNEWRQDNPVQGDIVQRLIERYRTPARWAKAVQHLREAGTLEGSPRDIGPLIKEAQVEE